MNSTSVKWQPPMVKVLTSVAPLVLFGVYLFGWRTLTMLAAVCIGGFLTEFAFTRRWKEPVSSAVFVTCVLFTLSLPPALPYWMATAGIVFGVLFGKMVFGGFGRNVFNPALTGRVFIYVCFGRHMTSMWSTPFSGSVGGVLCYAPSADALTTATPGMLLKTGLAQPWLPEFLGTTSGVIGGTSALLALIGGLYLVWTKAASYRIVLSGFAGFLVMQTALWLGGAEHAADPWQGLLTGSFVAGMFFYATDPVSASQTNPGRWIYGALIGMLSSLISVFSAWPAGTMFAILLANIFAPIMDHGVREMLKKRAPAKTAAAAG